jgi:hypothetical protein
VVTGASGFRAYPGRGNLSIMNVEYYGILKFYGEKHFSLRKRRWEDGDM